MKPTFKKLIPMCLLILIPIACKEAPLKDLEKGAQEAMEDARRKAKEWGGLSEEELKKIWAIEYKTIKVMHSDPAVLNEKLNELGKERWDCYHVSEDGQGKVFYLKRRKSNAVRYLTDLLRLGSWVF